jgi:ATP-dependent Lon protease
METEPEREELDVLMPLLPLQSVVVYPHSVATVEIGLDANTALLQDNPEPDALVVLAFCEPGVRATSSARPSRGWRS